MKVHLVGSGIASLAAAVYLIEDAKVAPSDIIIYEEKQKERAGGAMESYKVRVPPDGPKRPKFAYVLPATRVLEREYRCTRDLFSRFKSPDGKSIWRDVLDFNATNPYNDTTRLLHEIDGKKGQVVSIPPRMGISDEDSVTAARLVVTSYLLDNSPKFEKEILELVDPGENPDGKAIDDFFTPDFFESEFFLIWSTLMGPLREHSAIEFVRYFERFLHVLPSVDMMSDVWRMRWNQRDGVVRPITNELIRRGVHFIFDTVVEDIAFDKVGDGIKATSIKTRAKSPTGSATTADSFSRTGRRAESIPIGEGDFVFVTLGSQLANLRVGSIDKPPEPAERPEDAWALWARIAENAKDMGREDFGDPGVFFKKPNDPLSESSPWVTFTVTATDSRFLNLLEAKSKVEPLRQGLVSVIDSPWLITVAPFRKPHFADQEKDIWTWWGFSLCHDKKGDFDRRGEFVHRGITECSGSQILEETIEQLGFGGDKAHILESSACIPCLLPHAGSVWMRRKEADRPKVIPDGAKNFAFIGQFCEMPKDTMFTMEYSVRSAWTAVAGLFKLDKFKPPAVYQGLDDKRAVDAVFERFVVKQALEDVLKTPLFEAVQKLICH